MRVLIGCARPPCAAPTASHEGCAWPSLYDSASDKCPFASLDTHSTLPPLSKRPRDASNTAPSFTSRSQCPTQPPALPLRRPSHKPVLCGKPSPSPSISPRCVLSRIKPALPAACSAASSATTIPRAQPHQAQPPSSPSLRPLVPRPHPLALLTCTPALLPPAGDASPPPTPAQLPPRACHAPSPAQLA